MKKVFISSADKDQSLADFLSGELEKHGFETWNDADILPGEKWEDAITQALKEADIFMPLVSPAFMKSDFAIAELGSAYGMKKNMMPVLISGDIRQMPFHFSEFQLLDARKLDKTDLVNLIVENTRQQLLAA